MVRLGLLVIVVVGWVLWPEPASAQCVSFSKDFPCEVKGGPLNRLDFGAGKSQLPQTKPSAVVVAPVVIESQPGSDCKLVKAPDPQFHSNMPVIAPDSTKKYSLRVIVVPSCK